MNVALNYQCVYDVEDAAIDGGSSDGIDHPAGFQVPPNRGRTRGVLPHTENQLSRDRSRCDRGDRPLQD